MVARKLLYGTLSRYAPFTAANEHIVNRFTRQDELQYLIYQSYSIEV